MKLILNGVLKVSYKEKREFRRGDICLCEFVDVGGSVQSGLRPAVIIQNDIGNRFSSTLIVSPITSTIKKMKQPTHVFVSKEFGLPEDSMVMLEQIQTIDKKFHIREHIGFIDDVSMINKINKALRRSLALDELNGI